MGKYAPATSKDFFETRLCTERIEAVLEQNCQVQ